MLGQFSGQAQLHQAVEEGQAVGLGEGGEGGDGGGGVDSSRIIELYVSGVTLIENFQQGQTTRQLLDDVRPTRRAMTMAGKRMPRVERSVDSILAEVFTAKMSPKPTVVSDVRLK